jgi:PAS domain S-box-containing protein
MQTKEKMSIDALVAEFEQSSDCVKLIGLDGRVLWMNAEGLCAMEIDHFREIDSRQWTELWPEETRGTIRSGLVSAATGQIVRFNTFCPTIKGSARWWDVSISQIGDAGGNPVGYLAISRDITSTRPDS